MALYREWVVDGVLHIELLDLWSWITPEFNAAMDRGDFAEGRRLAGLEVEDVSR